MSEHLEKSEVPLAEVLEEYSLNGSPPQSVPVSPLHEQDGPSEHFLEETVVMSGHTSGLKRSLSSSDSSSSSPSEKKIRMQ